MIALPILSSIVAIMQLPQDAQIPMHWNAQGQVDRFGSPWDMLPVSFIMAACNSLLAVSYVFIDKLFDYGLVHGISRKSLPSVPLWHSSGFATHMGGHIDLLALSNWQHANLAI